MNLREANRLLMGAISNVMTDEQLDTKLPNGMTPRQIMRECALQYTQISPDAESVPGRPAAKLGPIKAYWHPHGYICPTKPNGEWLPLVLEQP